MPFKRLALLTPFLLVTAHAQQSGASAQSPLDLVQTIPLDPAIRGGFDHFEVDRKCQKLFVAAEDGKTVLIIDLAQGRVVGRIDGLLRPHAILYRADLDRLFITDGGDGSVKVYDAASYTLLGRIPLLKDADSIGYDASTHSLWVDNGGGDVGQSYSMLSVLDTSTNKELADIKIEGDTLEAMALDAYRPRLYVNDKAKNTVVVVDRERRAAVATWPISMGRGNVAMALDEYRQRLFLGCRDGHLVILDTNTGKELQSLPITPGVDEVIYDAGTKRVYALGGGKVDAFDQLSADEYKPAGVVEAGTTARTGRFVPELDRLFVAAPASQQESAKIVVFKPNNAANAPVRGPEPQEAVSAPRAESLVLQLLSEHPQLRRMGLHVIPPGSQTMVLIANGNATRIGIHTSPGDFAAVRDGKTYGPHIADGGFYNMKLPMFDSQARPIGILVMEIPDTSAQSEADAAHQAEQIRQELAGRIPSLGWLFATN